MRNCFGYLLILISFQGLVACQQEPQTIMPAISVPFRSLSDQTQIQAGAALFWRHCRECHGSLSEGRNPRATRFNPPPPDFFEQKYSSVDPAYLFWRIKEGQRIEPFRSRGSVMPAWGPYLTEKEIWSLVAFLRQRAGFGAQ